jgi:hypothetical protein
MNFSASLALAAPELILAGGALLLLVWGAFQPRAGQDQRQVTTVRHQRVPRSRRASGGTATGAASAASARGWTVAATWRCSSSVSVRVRPSVSLSSGR